MRAPPLRAAILVAAVSWVLGLSARPAGPSPLPEPPGTCRSEPRASQAQTYAPAPEGDRRWRAENPTHEIRAFFSDEGIRILPRVPRRPAWEWGISLIRIGGTEELQASGTAFPVMLNDRLEYQRGELVEWFRNSSKGIEHGLEISPPAGSALLLLDYALTGNLTPKVSEDGQKVAFRDTVGALILADLDLNALDSDGREVAVHWEWVEQDDDARPVLRLVLEGADHEFPLRVLGRLATPKGVRREAAVSQPGPEAEVLSAPGSDLCPGAEIIPAAGPFPYLSSIVDLTDATTTGDPPTPSCQASLSRSVWFAFTPATSAEYSFSVCSDAPTATTVEDTVLAIYSAAGACTGLVEISGGCSDDSCGPGALQSAVGHVPLSAGTTYYIVGWSYGTAVPPPGAGSLQLQVVQHAPPGPPPANDQCVSAEPIPGAGPFPYLTSVTADISGATTAGDPPTPLCQPNVSRSLWYSFTPTAGGRYTFSVCADGPTGSTVDDTVLAVYAASATCSGLVEASGGCDDDSCTSEAAQSRISGIDLTAGTTYYIVVWQYGNAPPAAGNTAIQVRVSQAASPPNDACSSATILALDAPVSGTTASAFDDTRLPSGSTCFAGIGQTASNAPGSEVSYRFTAPVAGKYSFRLNGYDSSCNAVLYVSSDCPAGAPPALVAACLGAANRSATSPEEVKCIPLLSGQNVYVHVDEDGLTSGSAFTLEANRCWEESEPNGTPASAGEPVCGLEGAVAPAGDADFFALGTAETGSRVFALADGAAGNSGDFDLRVTTGTDTLEYDDFNNDTPFGAIAPNAAGTLLNGTAAYLRVSHYSPAAQAEPYRLYATIQPPAARATPEVEPNSTVGTATGAFNEYFSGSLSGSSDVDMFSFFAAAQELIQIGLDLDPSRDNTPFNGSLALLDASGTPLLLVNDPAWTSSSASGAGNLSATAPYAPGEAMVYRIRSTGPYYVKVSWSAGTPGDYLLSISHNCRVAPSTNLAVTQADTPDPVAIGGNVFYGITVRNLGTNPASVVTLRDDLPPGAVFVSAVPSQGICSGSGPVTCHLGNLVGNGSATVNVVLAAPGTAGSISNTARISTAVVDLSPADDVWVETTQVGALDADGDGVSDSLDCAPANSGVWAVPGEATGLIFPDIGNPALLQWAAPASPGGTIVYYDLMRSPVASNFMTPSCLTSNITGTSGNDSESPLAVFYYLVRAENICGGNLGTRSDGTSRSAGSCP